MILTTSSTCEFKVKAIGKGGNSGYYSLHYND